MTQESPYNILTQEEQNIADYLSEILKNYVFVRKNGKSNFYIYNDMSFEDITDQQQKNDYNFALGVLNSSILGQGGHQTYKVEEKEDEYYTLFSIIVKKTFEMHVWSVNKNNSEVMIMGELTRKAIMNCPSIFQVGTDLNMYYRKLDNTTKPLNDAVFSFEIITEEIFREEANIITQATIEDRVVWLKQH